MAQFIGKLDGQSGKTVSRLGSKKSGVFATVNGWNSGVSVHAIFNEKENRDEFIILYAGGSTGSKPSRVAGVVYLDETGIVQFEPS